MTVIIILLSLTSSWAAAQPVTLTSDLMAAGKTYACPNQDVTYTCVSTSARLSWTAEPVLTDQFRITYTSSDAPPRNRSHSNLLLMLESTTPLTSTLQVKNATTNLEVVCTNETLTFGQTAQLQLAGSGRAPSSVSHLSVLASDQGNVSAFLNWTAPDHSGYDFSGYEVDIFVNNEKMYSVTVQTPYINLMFNVGMTATNGMAYAVIKTITACPGQESTGVQSREIFYFIVFSTSSSTSASSTIHNPGAISSIILGIVVVIFISHCDYCGLNCKGKNRTKTCTESKACPPNAENKGGYTSKHGGATTLNKDD